MTSVPVDTRPQPAVASPRAQSGFDWFLAVALVACGVAVVRALFFTPADAMLGDVQKLFYVHVPAAIAGVVRARPRSGSMTVRRVRARCGPGPARSSARAARSVRTRVLPRS